ncbi:MAG TPA: acetate kinase [Syntrophothermus lipocalidus]|uniref:Acetate kinase n=1 Tax=Syntrophothermus lipocalidus (strain DSM 12680 / TGB-C1) TaxID=643648 RepID=D7CLU8_SYNLT|nr:acetate kinase [Syntrophothermus lipocalidus]ADI01683.1 acetate kinase [Syntrophothermus lipocalidus DSM 12680]HHV77080.1 acetate kinase [Syntrophothermus lipocalidus]
MKVLVVNCGSSSIKYQLLDMTDESVLAKGLLDRVGIPGTVLKHEPVGKDEVVIKKDLPDHTEGMKLVLEVLVHPEYGVIKSMDEIGAVGHRVVHGGEAFAYSVVIDDRVKQVIRECFDIAPLHNPPNLMGIEACQALMPNIKHVAVFDTAFHQTMPAKNYMYALPYELYEKYKVRRYGFHGTSHFYVSHRAADLLGKPYEQCKIVTLHLGNGASMAAIMDGKVIDTSMGFTPLEGLVMGTRCGDIDPAIVFFIMEKLNLSTSEVNNYLNKKSGMLGLSGVSNDLRDIQEAAAAGNEKAQLALDVYYTRVKSYIGNYIAQLNGCDCLVFTAGVGENGIDMRENICKNLDYLGIKLDPEKNKVRGKEVDVAADDSKVRIFVIPTNEELVIARDTYQLAK